MTDSKTERVARAIWNTHNPRTKVAWSEVDSFVRALYRNMARAAIEYDVERTESRSAIGIDLGLKNTATCSNGERLERKGRYRQLEQALGIAQRAGHKKRAKSIHAKIKNQRNNDTHQFTSRLVRDHGAIFVGNVSSRGLTKTKMAKSVLDAGWYLLKTQLKYKAIARSVVFEEIDEAYSTQTCSCCGAISDSSPKGRTGLGIRQWVCSECGAEHDRDINAAKNILAAGGHARLDGGIAPFWLGEDVNNSNRALRMAGDR